MKEDCHKIPRVYEKLKDIGFEEFIKYESNKWKLGKYYNRFLVTIKKEGCLYIVFSDIANEKIESDFFTRINYISPECCLLQFYEALSSLDSVKYFNFGHAKLLKSLLQIDICELMRQ